MTRARWPDWRAEFPQEEFACVTSSKLPIHSWAQGERYLPPKSAVGIKNNTECLVLGRDPYVVEDTRYMISSSSSSPSSLYYYYNMITLLHFPGHKACYWTFTYFILHHPYLQGMQSWYYFRWQVTGWVSHDSHPVLLQRVSAEGGFRVSSSIWAIQRGARKTPRAGTQTLGKAARRTGLHPVT